MAESNLNLMKADFESKVGIYLGWGDGVATAWSTTQKNRLKDAVDSGYRQFIVPMADANGSSHDWSFLRPTVSLALVSGMQTVQLPDDYGSLDGTITVTQTANAMNWPVQVTGENKIREMYARLPNATGRPIWAAEQPLKGTTKLKSSRFQLYIYPAPDDNFTLTFAYYLLPEALTDANPYCYGGMQHAETILESCLAIAEERINDQQNGLHSTKFMQRLQASIAIDRRNKAQLVGYNGDRSDQRGGYWPWRQGYLDSQITYYGNLPG